MTRRLFVLPEGAVQVYVYKFNREFIIYILRNIGYFFTWEKKERYCRYNKYLTDAKVKESHRGEKKRD